MQQPFFVHTIVFFLVHVLMYEQANWSLALRLLCGSGYIVCDCQCHVACVHCEVMVYRAIM